MSDQAGNSTSISLAGINVDQTKPTVTILSHPNGSTNDTSAAFTFSGNDALSGVDHLEYSLDGGDYLIGDSAGFAGLADGSHILSVRSVDKASNVSEVASFAWVIDTTTTTSLSSSTNAPTYGDSVILTATVQSGVPTVASGTVTFKDGETVLGTASLDGMGQASITLTNLNAGTHHFTAVYSGSANGTALFQGSSGSLDQQMAQATPMVSVVGGSFTYDGSAHPATGSVTGVGGASLGSPTFAYSYTDDNGNVVKMSSAPVDPGYYTVTASFAGDGNYTPASASTNLIIAYNAQSLTDLSRALNPGRTIPIKLRLTDAAGKNVSSSSIDLTAVRLERVNVDGTTTQVSLQDAGNSNPGNLFRYDASLGGYIFNLSTKGLGAGAYNFFWTAEGDPTQHELSFKLA